MNSTPLEISYIAVADIVVARTRRSLSPQFVVTLAESMATLGLRSPIELAIDGNGQYHLVFGAHRLAAAKELGWRTIPAVVSSLEDVTTASEVKLCEISENLVRNNLSVLDRSFDIGDWRDLYLTRNEVSKGGRPKTIPVAEWEEQQSARFALSFSDVAQVTLDISRRSVFNCLKIASLGEPIRQRLSNHALANNQGDLLLLAAEPDKRRAQIVDILTAEEPQATTVAAANDILDEVPAARSLERWQKVYAKFSTLKESEQHQFFEINAGAIKSWLEARKN